MDDPVMKINQNHEISLSVIHIPCLLNQTEIDRVFPGPYWLEWRPCCSNKSTILWWQPQLILQQISGCSFSSFFLQQQQNKLLKYGRFAQCFRQYIFCRLILRALSWVAYHSGSRGELLMTTVLCDYQCNVNTAWPVRLITTFHWYHNKSSVTVHCWASRHSLGFEDEDLGSSPGCRAATVAI